MGAKEAVQQPVGTCPECGKKSFVSRKAALRFGRKAHPNTKLNAYDCGRYFHYGHLPLRVREGRVPRATLRTPVSF